MTENTNQSKTSESAWSPLKISVFRALWIATIAGNVGTWMQNVGASWMMTSLSTSPFFVSLVQTATSLPIFMLALPAGALADVVDRRRLMIFTQLWMLCASATLGILTIFGLVDAYILLFLTFALGIGAALNAPASEAIVPELVPRDQLLPAVTLNSAGINVSRAIGPALGGFIVAFWGAGFVFLLNAITFLGVAFVVFRWKRTEKENLLPKERFIGAIKAGFRYARNSPPLIAVMVRTIVFMIFASATLSLLPLVARNELNSGASGYGTLLGSLGIGAILGTILMPKLRNKLSVDWLIAVATILFSAVALGLAYIRNFWVVCFIMAFGGIGWVIVVSSLKVSTQKASPVWVKARALALYLLVFEGSMAIGSAVWGVIAGQIGITTTLTIAAFGLIIGLLTMLRFRLQAGENLNLDPSKHWTTLSVADEVKQQEDLERGPVMVTVEYRIDPKQDAEFRKVMQKVRAERRRSGATFWGLYIDEEDSERYLEFFTHEFWLEHLRHHEHVTVADHDVETLARKFHIGNEPPKVSHFVSNYGNKKEKITMNETENLSEQPMSEEEIDETLDDSFPASDPPSWSLGTDHGKKEIEKE